MRHCRRTKSARRRDKDQLFVVRLLIAVLLLVVLMHSSTSSVRATSSSTFPGRMPPPVRVEPSNSNSSSPKGSVVVGGDGSSSDDDRGGGGGGGGDSDEIESSSDDDSLALPLVLRQQQQWSDSASTRPPTAAAGPSPPKMRSGARSSSRPEGSAAPVTHAGAQVKNDVAAAAAATAAAATAAAAAPPVPPSQPLQTLQKLQSMLDETDYLTTSRRKQQQSTKAHDSVPTSVPETTAPSAPSAASSALSAPGANANATDAPLPPDVGRLWTSKDRAKYKKQQHKIRKTQEGLVHPSDLKERPILKEFPQSSPPIHPFSDDEQDHVSDDFDDGLGFSLPNVPVYYSDAEGDSDGGTDEPVSAAPLRPLSTTAPEPPPPREAIPGPSTPRIQANHTGSVPYQPPPPPSNYYEAQRMASSAASPQSFGPPTQGERVPQQQLYYPPYPPYGFPFAYPPHHYGSYMHPSAYHGQFASWNPTLPPPPGLGQSRAAAYPPGGPALPRQYPARGVVPPPQAARTTASAEASRPLRNATSIGDAMEGEASSGRSGTTVDNSRKSAALRHPQHEASVAFVDPHMNYYGMAPAYFLAPENPQSLAEASSYLNLASIEKVSLLVATVALACYAGVSPRTLPLTEYNLMFYENLRLVSLALIAPAVQILSVCDARENDINSLTNAFFVSFTVGILLTFVAELVATTLVRLAVFYIFEPKIFAVAPTVPALVLPWVLRDIKYRPKRITLFAADFATSCVACPVIEEYIKLLLLRWTVTLPRNFNWVTRASAKTKRKKRVVAEPIPRNPGEKDVTTANKYVTQMLAVSLGLKLCDAGRRILLYTKAHHANKSFFAIFRGIFPIQELCGTVTALALAKRDLLGFYTPLWKILAPAVVFHGMANYRGMKPIFKWNASTPWSEMQLYPLNFADSSTFPQLLSKGFGKFMWFVVLGRVLGYCIKNYYMVNRQAVKRTTTYAGKHSAFSAELETAEALKKQKQK